jgi:ribosomal subunit interface protein
MQVPLQIVFHGVAGSESLERLIEEKVAWLEKFQSRIISCRVVVEVPHRHHRQGNQYQVRIDLTLPGGEIVVNREPPRRRETQDLAVAIRDAFDAAHRQLENFTSRQRHEVKQHESSPHARVTMLFAQEGYGFLRTPDGREVYFHQNAVCNGDFADIEVGSEVAFVEEAGQKGPQASTVRLVGQHNHRFVRDEG